MDMKTPLVLVVSIPSAAASSVDGHVFTVPTGAEYELVEVSEAHTVAGSDGGSVTADIVKCASATAPGSGTSLLASTFNLKSTANTPVTKNTASGLSTSLATRTLTGGQSLAINFGGTLTAYAGASFTFSLKMRRPPTYR